MTARLARQLKTHTLLLVSTLLTISLNGATAEKVANPIPIGLSVAQTSSAALLGQEQVIGAQIAEEFFNAQGGIGGTPFKLILEDTGGDEAGAIHSFGLQLERNKVVALIGPTLSQQAFAADPLAEKAGVPVVGPSTTARGIPQIGKFIARVSASVDMVAPNALRAALEQNPKIRRVAFFYAQNDAFASSETVVFQSAAAAQKLEKVSVQKFKTIDSDFAGMVAATLAQKPDLVIVSGLALDSGNLIRQLRKAGFKGTIIGGNGLNTANVFPVCREDCDGVLVAQAYNPQENSPIQTAFRERYKAQYRKEPPQFSAQAFAAVQVVVEALRKVDLQKKVSNWTLEELRPALNKQILAGRYQTPLGTLAFTLEGEVIQQKFYVAQIRMNSDGKTGKFEILPRAYP
jgi:branched-chain amino acid transport system substrate-binding protein